MTTVDIDNDGDLDVVIISQHAAGGDVYPHGFEGIIVFKNDGKGIFNQLELYPAGNYFDIYFPEFVYSSDFNNDSFTDIAVMADFAGTILLNSGEGAFTNDSANTRTFWGAEQISPFTCADINGDKWIDIVKSGYKFPPEMPITYYAIVTNCNSNFFNCSGSNFFGYKLPDVLIYAAAAVDLDADSDVDLVHAGEGIFITLNRDTINSVYDNYEQPEDFSVYQNYPNPFNSQTKIIFIANKIEFIHITIYNVLGEEVRLLENKMFLPGKNSVIWDGKDNGGSSLPSGIYFIHAKASTSAQTIKAILLK
jgi:hypothetical protein